MNELFIHGYALHWNEIARIYEDGETFYEQFQQGAFTDSLKQRNQKALVLHKSLLDIASVEAGTMFIYEDEVGLAFQIKLQNDSEGRSIYDLVKDGQLKHASVLFVPVKGEVGKRRGLKYRVIKKAQLEEISLVDNPAYETSSVQIGSNTRVMLLAKIQAALSI